MSLDPLLMKPDSKRTSREESRDAFKRILVVDDLPEMCDYLRTILNRIRSPHVHVETEFNAERALELVRANPYDLVLCDARMPIVDGIEILRTARSRNPEGLRFLITAYDNLPRGEGDLKEAGLDAFIRKPVRAQQVLQIVMDFLQASPEALSKWRAAAKDPLGFIYSADEAPGGPRLE